MIRCAEHGCFVLTASESGVQSSWLPAYHSTGSDNVIDTTGAGNAFLGGAAIGYLQHKDFTLAAAYGSVAASFAVETVGLPELGACDVEGRLIEYMKRLR